jgi:trehalose 6-phosphate synthase/phosphatase
VVLEGQESIHPGLRPSLTAVPVTPGILPGEYVSEDSPSYFAHDISRLQKAMAQSPGDAAAGARSNQEVLRRMSLTGGPKRKDSLNEIDPRAANPSLGLSGGIISATFCIPYSLQFRKGADWVSFHIVTLRFLDSSLARN